MEPALTGLTGLAKLKAKLVIEAEEERNLEESPKSELSATSTTLATFLTIYTKSNPECYLNYMEGAKTLLAYLAPFGTPLDYELDKYPEASSLEFKVPSLLIGYESRELAKLLEPRTKHPKLDDWVAALVRIEKLIYLILLRIENTTLL